jgi:bifunctional non-homologous end joining protein LigD
MLPSTGPLPPDDGRWSFEVKWDGVRALGLVRGGVLRLRSRSGRELGAAFPELQAPAGLARRDVLVDGELVALDPASGRPDIERIRARLGRSGAGAALGARTSPAVYVVFDLLWCSGHSLLDKPYAQRRKALERLGLSGGSLQVTPAFPAAGAALYDATSRHELEGVVAKRLDSSYRPGRRCATWVKTKHVQRSSLPVVGWSGVDRVSALHLAVPDEGGLRYAGAVGFGLAPALRAGLGAALGALEIREPPSPLPALAGVRWLRPLLVAQVRHAGWGAAGRLRHPYCESVTVAGGR